MTGIGRTPREVEILKSFFPDIVLFNNDSNSWSLSSRSRARASPNHEFSALYNADRAHPFGAGCTTTTRSVEGVPERRGRVWRSTELCLGRGT